MNVLILGSGGREHTLAWKISQSPKLGQLYVAPGNAGTSAVASNVALSPTDFDGIADFCLKNAIQMVVVGPEAPLVEGIADFFADRTDLAAIKMIGPKKAGAKLEGSKDFSKNFMVKHGIPTAASQTFTKETYEKGLAYLANQQAPYVLKADGLAAGKGVIIAQTLEEAQKALKTMLLDEQFGDASAQVLIEEFMAGIELSVFALTDGKDYVIMPSAKDYKRIGEGDTGLNTGGMGAISPVPFATDDFLQTVEKQVIQPTIQGLIKDGIDYVGFIYFGLMNINGQAKVVEYNARLGDPETEVVLPRLKSDLLELFDLTAQGRIKEAQVSFDERTASTVMLVSGGYPEAYEKGKTMTGFDGLNDVIPFHAGTTTNDNQVVTNGGRVIAITAFGHTMEEALGKSYQGARAIHFDKKYFRTDIGFDLKG